MTTSRILLVLWLSMQELTHSYDSGTCYRELGCFPNTYPWISILRPFPKPQDPWIIDTKINLYTTKKSKEHFTVTLWKNISLEHSDFDPNRPHTLFIIHGFASSGNESWVEDLKNAYLKRRNANVFIVDWSRGANSWNYLQVAANTRIVGAELKRFGQYLVGLKGLSPAKIHLIGHSLGAHIASYMGKGIPHVDQITGLDPAKPGFEKCSDEVRLNKNDAQFVEVIHTNTKAIKPLVAFGLMTPSGHNDYYVNDGLLQPGCKLPMIFDIEPNATLELGKYTTEGLRLRHQGSNEKRNLLVLKLIVIGNWVSCSHGRSQQYYIESLLNAECMFWGTSACLPSEIFDIHYFGKYFKKILQWLTKCKLNNCSPIGLDSKRYPARGVFIIPTNPKHPFCKDDSITTTMMKKYLAEEY